MKIPGWLSEAVTVVAFFCSLLNAGEPVTAAATVTEGLWTSAPVLNLGTSPLPLGLTVDPGPSLRIRGNSGTTVRVDWAEEISGPWMPWSNVVVGASGLVRVELSGEGDRRFYRTQTVSDPRPAGPTDFVWVGPGAFVMGTSLSEPDRQNDEVQHTVVLTRGFWLSDHEVTQAEYQAVMGENPSFFKGDTNRPVENVDWYQAVEYCKKLTEKDRAAGRITAQQEYRLPTEAEWEYAARAGTTEQRYGELDLIAWWTGNSESKTHPVKTKAANAWRLYDMIGNVEEWCADWRDEYPIGTAVDPIGPELADGSGGVRVIRGGSWVNQPEQARSAYRVSFRPYMRTDYLGFRTALSAGPTTQFVAPSITVSPRSATVRAGQTARFTVMVAGTAPLTFQWQLNGVDLAGATAADYTVNNAQLANAGEYRVVVSNSAGSVTSTPAVLTMNQLAGTSGFVWIEPGTFVMGSPSSEVGRSDGEFQHTVTLTQGFWLSDHEVTQSEYQSVMGINPSFFKGDLNRPVETVSWEDAVRYCQRLTERERAAGLITAREAYRLPTEAEWEYAARAGTREARHGELDAIAWWFGNSGNQTRPVKQKAPNAWGLYDMIGNVWEWCSDWYGAYPTGNVTDPMGASSGSDRVDRGGGWGSGTERVRSAYRDGDDPGARFTLGFRPALSAIR
jgi:formylglycine-generating enzyme required for sulfatase activity